VFDGYDEIARLHVYDKCVELDISWSEVEEMIAVGEVIEEHHFDDLAVKEIRLLVDWKQPLHMVCVVHHDRRLVVFRTIYIPTLDQWKPGFRERRK